MLSWNCNCSCVWGLLNGERGTWLTGPYRGFLWGSSAFLSSNVIPFLHAPHTHVHTHKHTSHIPTGSTALPLIILSGCHSNPCSQVPSWTSFTRHQNIFLHCSHGKSRAWIGLRWLQGWPAVSMVGKGSEKTPDHSRGRLPVVYSEWLTRKGSDYTGNLPLDTPQDLDSRRQGQLRAEPQLLGPKYLPPNMGSLSTLRPTGLSWTEIVPLLLF